MVLMSEVAPELATELREHAGRRGVYVVAIAPESLRLAVEVAQRLRVPFNLFPVRALPSADEHGTPVGIVGPGGVLVIDQDAVREQGCSVATLAQAAQASARALATFEQALRDGAEPPDLRGSTIILLDDGRTSIHLLRMAITALRRSWVRATVLALPTITVSELQLVRAEADAIVSAVVPDGSAPVPPVGPQSPLSVAEIRELLAASAPGQPRLVHQTVTVQPAPVPSAGRVHQGLSTSATAGH